MATGIFESQIMQGSSLGGESFVQQPVAFDPSAGLEQLGQAVDVAVQTHRFDKATEEVQQEQNLFLEDVQVMRQAKAEIDELKRTAPQEGAAFESARDRIKTLQQGINSRQINPATAISRIEAIKREALSRAPMFSAQIRGLSGGRGAEFDETATQLIKETNFVRDEMNKYYLDPDIPSHREKYSQIVAAQTEAQLAGDLKVLDTVTAGRVLNKSLNAITSAVGSKEFEILSNPTLVQGMSTEERTQLSLKAQSLMNGNEYALINDALNRSGLTELQVSRIDDAIIERHAKILRGKGEAMFKIANGKVPEELARSQLNLEKDKVMLDVADKNPGLFTGIQLLSAMPPDAIINTTFKEYMGQNVLEYTKSMGLGQADATTQSGMASRGVENPAETQNFFAKNIDRIRGAWKKTPDPDPVDLAGTGNIIYNSARAIGLNPEEFTAQSFDSMIKTVNDQKFMDMWKNADPTTQAQFATTMRDTMQVFVRENMAVDMNTQLNRPIAPGSAQTVRDMVSIVVQPNGSLQFIPNTDFDNPRKQVQADNIAQKMNKMYAERISSTLRAGEVLGHLDNDEARREFTLRMMSEPLLDIQEPIRVKGESIAEAKAKHKAFLERQQKAITKMLEEGQKRNIIINEDAISQLGLQEFLEDTE